MFRSNVSKYWYMMAYHGTSVLHPCRQYVPAHFRSTCASTNLDPSQYSITYDYSSLIFMHEAMTNVHQWGSLSSAPNSPKSRSGHLRLDCQSVRHHQTRLLAGPSLTDWTDGLSVIVRPDCWSVSHYQTGPSVRPPSSDQTAVQTAVWTISL